MGIYRIIRRQFAYLEKSYGFVNVLNQRHGSYYYAVWSNYQKNIMVLYNELDDEPVSIRIYDRMMLRSRILAGKYDSFISTRGFIEAEAHEHSEFSVLDAENMKGQTQ